MTDSPTCPACGAPLARSSIGEMCPACLLRAAMEGESLPVAKPLILANLDTLQALDPDLEIIASARSWRGSAAETVDPIPPVSDEPKRPPRKGPSL